MHKGQGRTPKTCTEALRVAPSVAERRATTKRVLPPRQSDRAPLGVAAANGAPFLGNFERDPVRLRAAGLAALGYDREAI
jgi:hypothetical protein